MKRDIDGAQGSISRREILLGTAGLVTVAASLGAAAADEHKGHMAADPKRYSAAAAYKKHVAAIAAAEKCIETARPCLSHCFETFVAGDTIMAECALAVEQTLHVCDTFAYLAAYDSKQLVAMARVCIASCEDCEKACRVHEEHQPECKACADACAVLIKEAKKLLA